VIGVVSDTHGLLRPEVLEALAGAELIVHAGDVGDQSVLQELQLVAPVLAVRGNVDGGSGTGSLPLTRVVEVGRHTIYVLHRLSDLDLDPAAAGLAAVVYGHSHAPALFWRYGVLFLNPGSAGPRRFRLPVSIATIEVEGDTLKPRLVELENGRRPDA
jgi:uncharacterized protein